eukprot:gene6176-7861_t
MSRIPPHPDSVAEALLLIGLPACACGRDGLVLASSPELDQLLGFAAKGRPAADVFARNARADSVARLNQALEAGAGAVLQWDSCLAHADGQYIPVQATLKPLPGEGAAAGTW